MQSIVSIHSLSKIYDSGHQALSNVDLEIHEGEILALLGPNGAGKTTLISIICGIVSSSSVAGHDIVRDYRVTRDLIGLVPQELTLGAFDTVWNTVRFSRGLFGKKPNAAYLEQLLKDLSLWDKRGNELRELSGGMKRRVLIAKALSHEPRILFLDEPTAGVDVELRQDMWKMVRRLNDSGVTIILTTHYIEEAEEIADRVGVINDGRLLLVDDKRCLMQNLGKKQLLIELRQAIDELPSELAGYGLEASADGTQLVYTYDVHGDGTGISTMLQELHTSGLKLKDLKSSQSSLEEIFVKLVKAG